MEALKASVASCCVSSAIVFTEYRLRRRLLIQLRMPNPKIIPDNVKIKSIVIDSCVTRSNPLATITGEKASMMDLMTI